MIDDRLTGKWVLISGSSNPLATEMFLGRMAKITGYVPAFDLWEADMKSGIHVALYRDEFTVLF